MGQVCLVFLLQPAPPPPAQAQAQAQETQAQAHDDDLPPKPPIGKKPPLRCCSVLLPATAAAPGVMV